MRGAGRASCGLPLSAEAVSALRAVGTSCYFWSLSSDRTNKARVKHASLTAELASVSTSCADLEAKLEVVRPPPDTEERAAAVAAAAAAQSRHDALSAEVSSHAESDPETLNAMTALAPTALEAANRWTDNIYMVQSYLTRNKGMSAADCQKWVLGEANVNLASLEYVTEESIKASVQPKKPKSKPASGGIKRKAAAAEDGYDD